MPPSKRRRTNAARPRRAPSARRPGRRPRPAPSRTPVAGGLAAGTSGLAPGMQAVNTYLAVANVGATADFLERAFGFTRGVVLPDAAGQIRYAEMRHRDSVVMLVPKGDGTSATGGAAALYTYVDDVDGALRRAREAGAGVGDAEDKAWGDRVGIATDPDGYRWILATFKKLAPFQSQQERRSGKDRRRTE